MNYFKTILFLIFTTSHFITNALVAGDSTIIEFNQYRLISIKSVNFKNNYGFYMSTYTFCSTNGRKDTVVIDYTTHSTLAANPIGRFVCYMYIDSTYNILCRRACLNELRDHPNNYYFIYMNLKLNKFDCSTLVRKKKIKKPKQLQLVAQDSYNNYVSIDSHLYEIIFIKSAYMPCIIRN